jgi:hypothetical protein
VSSFSVCNENPEENKALQGGDQTGRGENNRRENNRREQSFCGNDGRYRRENNRREQSLCGNDGRWCRAGSASRKGDISRNRKNLIQYLILFYVFSQDS